MTMLITITLLVFGAWGCCKMKYLFDPALLHPSDSYMRAQKEFYPQSGWVADVYSGELSYEDLENIETLVAELENLKEDGKTLKG